MQIGGINMWWDIIKRLKTQGKTSLTGFKIEDVNEERPDVEEDDCNRRLQEMARKLKHLKVPMKDLAAHGGDDWTVIVKPMGDETEVGLFSIKEGLVPLFKVVIGHKYEPIPEKVACRALELFDQLGDNDSVVEIVDSYRIYIEKTVENTGILQNVGAIYIGTTPPTRKYIQLSAYLSSNWRKLGSMQHEDRAFINESRLQKIYDSLKWWK
tara:strand:- start:2313 stop:2945 length:633 start_codon:yes stop_codon:yes gene_type:complete